MLFLIKTNIQFLILKFTLLCIVSFIPFQHTFFLTHTRDENIYRPFDQNVQYQNESSFPIHYLLDIPSQGTWMLDHPLFMGCVLNGAQDSELTDQKFPKSRGQLLLDLIAFEKLELYFHQNFKDFGPFTLIIFKKKIQHSCNSLGMEIILT